MTLPDGATLFVSGFVVAVGWGLGCWLVSAVRAGRRLIPCR